MAGKSVKRAKIDAQLSTEASNGLRMACGANTAEPTRASGDHLQRNEEEKKLAEAGLVPRRPEVVDKLQLELDVATKCIEQLRRETGYAERRVRDEEQARSSTALKDLEARLKADGEKARETLKSRLEADAARLAGRYERTIKRLSGDLDKCRNELREEVEKRGMSSSTRGGFEDERVRLLTEVRDLKAAKRRLEEKIESSAEVDKQRTAEMKRTQEACRAEVAKVSKEANAEIRKLLEELKAKDHQLALLDRNQYSDRGASLPKQSTVTENQPNEPEVTSSVLPKPVKPTVSPPVGEVVGKNGNQANLETVGNLKKDLEKLNDKLSASESERKRLRARVDELCQELAQRNETIANLRKRDTSASSSDQKQKAQPKAVRFLLPGCTLPVLAREVDVTTATSTSYDDDNVSITSDVSCSSLSSTTSSVLTPDTTTLYDENIEKNYHMLLSEHLNLQRSIALLLSSWSGSTSSSTASVTPSTPAAAAAVPQASSVRESDDNKTELQPTCRQECVLEKDSLKTTVGTLEDKVNKMEQNEELMKQKLQEQNEQCEELEFRVLELEECAEKCKMTHSGNAAEELFEKIRSLEDELSRSTDKVNYYRKLENDSACGGNISLGDYIDLIKHRELDAQGRSEMLRQEVMTLKRKLEGNVKLQPEVPATLSQKISRVLETEQLSIPKSGTTKIELLPGSSDADCDDLLSMCPMNCSMSTTSGYDDNSCASSVADMRLDDLPSEEAWGFEDEDDVTRADDDAVENRRSVAAGKPDPTVQTAASAAMPGTGAALPVQDSKTSPAEEEYVPVETLRQVEQSWLTRLETMETRLAQAIQSEQRARDQVALLGEEKDRRIVALQKQVDMLEANEFRIAETIQALERLEVTFSQLTSSSSKCSRSSSVSDEDALSTAAVANVSKIEEDHDDKPLDFILETDLFNEHRCMVSGEACIQCEAGRVLKSSLEKLRSAQNENEALDKRINELSEEAAGNTEPELAVRSSTTSNEAFPDYESIDFKAEYRELELLVRDLKKVLLVDNRQGESSENGTKTAAESAFEHEDYSCGGLGVVVRPVGFPDPMTQSWSTVASENCLYSLPNSPVFDLQSPVIGLLRERCREYELSGQQLTQQVANLERERDSLRETVDGSEATVRELGIRLLELQASESSLKDEVDRLRTKDHWMSGRSDELMELISRLESTVDQHRATEIDFRSRLDRNAARETELGRELEDARDEARSDETRYRRWIAQLEDERATLRTAVDELTGRNADLESREAGLLCRIRRLETVETGLRSDVAELERALDEQASNSRSEDGQTAAIQAVIDVEDESIQTEVEVTLPGKDSDDSYLQLTERAEFFKEMLEFYEQSNMALEAKLKQSTASEGALRGSVAEYEKMDEIWQNKVQNLEVKNANLEEQISGLESTIAEMKTRYDQQQQLFMDNVVADVDPTHDEFDFVQSRQNALSALRGLLLLSDVADEVDDTELAYWAAVEVAPATPGDGVTETDLASPFWSAVEARMGLKIDDANVDTTAERLKDGDERLQSPPTTTTEPEATVRRRLPWSQQPKPTMLNHSPEASTIGNNNSNNNEAQQATVNGPTTTADTTTTNHLQVAVSPRCRSADIFATQSSREPSGERRQPQQQRASSESRVVPAPFVVSPATTDAGNAFSPVGAEEPQSPISPSSSLAGDSVMDRIHRSRQFWSSKSSEPQPPLPVQNGRRSLIPRIMPTASRSQQNSLKLDTTLSTLPVIKSTPLSPTSPLQVDDRKGKSGLPRPIQDHRSTNEGKDFRDQTNSTEAKVTKEQSGQQITPKVYTTVFGANRYNMTPKFSYTGSSSQPPRAGAVRGGGAGKASDSKTSPTNPHSSKTGQQQQLLQRPVVHVSSSSTDVISKPEVGTSLLPAGGRD